MIEPVFDVGDRVERVWANGKIGPRGTITAVRAAYTDDLNTTRLVFEVLWDRRLLDRDDFGTYFDHELRHMSAVERLGELA